MTQFIPKFAQDSLAGAAPPIAVPAPPIPGMHEIPFGLPEMQGAWAGCVSWALSVPELREQFKAETGHDLDALAGAQGLDQMIDEATGRSRDVLVAWCDWVTTYVWGPATLFEELKGGEV
jgi:hypothetical protein